MAEFHGTIREFVKFVGPYARLKVAFMACKYKKEKGNCEDCGYVGTLDAAHIKGRERSVITSNIDAWGRGTIKIINSCKDAGLPEPEIKEEDGGMLVILFKDSLKEDQLQKKGLNERQVKGVLYVKEKGSITNTQYQKLTGIAKATATRDLKQLVEDFKLLEKSGITGVGTSYILKGS